MSYTARVQPRQPVPYADMEAYLAGLPGMRSGAGQFLYADEEDDVTTEIRPVCDGGDATAVDVTAPMPLSQGAAERLAAFTAGLAAHYGGVVRDARSGAEVGERAMAAAFMHAAPGARTGCGFVALLCVACGWLSYGLLTGRWRA